MIGLIRHSSTSKFFFGTLVVYFSYFIVIHKRFSIQLNVNHSAVRDIIMCFVLGSTAGYCL